MSSYSFEHLVVELVGIELGERVFLGIEDLADADVADPSPRE